MAESTVQTLEVGEEARGQRLDRLLAERLELSRSQVRRLLGRGAVRVDGRVAGESDKGRVTAPGMQIEVEAFQRPGDEMAASAPELELTVLAEGDGWWVVDKPAGMPVHPLAVDQRHTVLNALIALHPEIHGVGEGGLRSGVVHRLDVDTSGALVFARTQTAWQRLRSAFADHRVEKVYRAIVLGEMRGEGEVDVGLVTARHRPAKVRVVDDAERRQARGARDAQLRWRVLEPLAGATLIEVRPRTGFLHQIRVTLAHLGHPVAGDRTYGSGADPTAAGRHMLHAADVAVDELSAHSPDPEDFEQLRLRLLEQRS